MAHRTLRMHALTKRLSAGMATIPSLPSPHFLFAHRDFGRAKLQHMATSQRFFVSTESKAQMPDPALERCSSCFFPTEFHSVPLLKVRPVNHDTKVFTFALPLGVSLDLPVCACILLQGFDAEGKAVVRPYTPISPNDRTGEFDLLVKVYDNGVVSQWLSSLSEGAMVGFKHIPFNIKAQYPFAGTKRINLICGGTGVTPMYQALLKIATTPGDALEVVCLVGNRTVQDILLRDEMQALAERSGGRIKVVHVVGNAPDQGPVPGWDGELGWVDEEKISTHCFGPAPDTMTMVCGVPGLYEVLCGPRTEPELKPGTVLHKLGYTSETVAKM